MSQFQITCEAEDPRNQKVSHLPPYFYCSLCSLTICTTCLIKHLCTVQHTDPNSIIPIDKALEKRKEKIRLYEEKVTKSYQELALADYNELITFITNKKNELSKNFNQLFTLLKSMEDNALNAIESFTKDIQGMNGGDNGHVPNDIMEEYMKLINELRGFQNSMDIEGRSANAIMKEVAELEKKTTVFIEKINKEKKNNKSTSSMIEKCNEIKKKIFNLDVGVFFSEINKYTEKNKFQIQQFDEMKDAQSQGFDMSQPQLNDSIFMNSDIPREFEYPYNSELLISIRNIDEKHQNPVIIYDTQEKQFHQLKITAQNFIDGFTPFFPYKFNKFTNIGNNTVIITGGIVDSNITNRVYKLRVSKDNNGNYTAQVNQLKSLKNSRQHHNIIFLPKSNRVMVTCGQSLKSSEWLDLSRPESEWGMLPYTNKVRANATMFLINNTYVYLVGGFSQDEEKYTEGYERLNLNKLSEGWVQFDLANLAISTMGVITLEDNAVLLLGGFKGGKKYLNEGMVLTVDKEQYTISKVENKPELIKKGVIFYCSQQFVKSNGQITNIDFRGNFLIFHRDIFKVSIGSTCK